jgi:3',5'-cyclic AMP phosphodiesterase CpdA
MTRLFWTLGALFFSLTFVFSQDTTIVRVTDLNKELPGARFKFSFIHLTDIHIGEGQGDYGSTGFLDDIMPEGDVGYTAERLRHAVNWINEHAAQFDIRFVVVTGDITDSGERSEFEKAKEILGALNIPYVPQIGNHDIWPYVRYGFEAEYAYGDSVMNDVFKDVYDSLSHFFDFWDDGTRLSRVYNPEAEMEHYHQNFMFEYQGFGFFCFDHNPRYHVRKEEPGIGAEARLNDFAGGSFEWLSTQLESYPNKGVHNIFLLTHQPPHRDPISLINGLPVDQYDKITKALLPYSSHLAYWLAGHVHRNRNYNVNTLFGGQKVIEAWETTANKEFEKGYFRLINVYEAPRVTAVTDNSFDRAVSIEPNPGSGFFNVRLPLMEDAISIHLFDLSGKQAMQSIYAPQGVQQMPLDIRQLPAGTYLLQVQSGERMATKKIIKQ